MSGRDPLASGPRARSALSLVGNLRLVLRLFRDRRVPWWIKAIPFLALGYIIWPLDILPDALLGLGQMDDLGILLLGLEAFLGLVPQGLMREHQEIISRGRSGSGKPEGDVVDTTYRVVDK